MCVTSWPHSAVPSSPRRLPRRSAHSTPRRDIQCIRLTMLHSLLCTAPAVSSDRLSAGDDPCITLNTNNSVVLCESGHMLSTQCEVSSAAFQRPSSDLAANRRNMLPVGSKFGRATEMVMHHQSYSTVIAHYWVLLVACLQPVITRTEGSRRPAADTQLYRTHVSLKQSLLIKVSGCLKHRSTSCVA